jgi:hypothetical protein
MVLTFWICRNFFLAITHPCLPAFEAPAFADRSERKDARFQFHVDREHQKIRSIARFIRGDKFFRKIFLADEPNPRRPRI